MGEGEGVVVITHTRWLDVDGVGGYIMFGCVYKLVLDNKKVRGLCMYSGLSPDREMWPRGFTAAAVMKMTSSDTPAGMV